MKQKQKTHSFFRRILVLPFAVAMLFPLLFFDICLSLYHRIAFGICKIKKVNRKAHFKVDQMKIAQLSKLERVYAVCHLYVKGLMSFALKIASESENYWCKPRVIRGRQKMMIDKGKMSIKELKAYQDSVKQKPKKSRKKK